MQLNWFQTLILVLMSALIILWIGRSVATTRVVNLIRGAEEPLPVRALFSGTLAYDEDNRGREVPYVVYQDAGGVTQTKGLAFDDASECLTANGDYPCPLIADAFRHYFGGGPVEITGYPLASSLVVQYMRPAPGE